MKKIVHYLMIVSVVLILSSSGCEDVFPSSSIELKNDSDTDINYYFAFGGEGGLLYPDTLLPLTLTPPLPKARKGYSGYTDCHCTEEELIDNLPADTLSIYIFHPDTLMEYTWKEIIEDYNILKRYDVSLEDLQRLNFTVTYPPTQEMSDIKMWLRE